MTRAQAAAVLADLKDAYPYFRLEEGTVDLYLRNLEEHLEQHEGKAAAKKWVVTNSRFPAVSEFLDMALGMRKKAVDLPTATAKDIELATPEEIRAAIRPLIAKLRGDEE